ncbi:MAG: class I SAM-dependent methyltransferase [Phycisphaerales bacterium]|nr:class I SAM-dependent methyltransferase [Phycisphaerales bacterium]
MSASPDQTIRGFPVLRRRVRVGERVYELVGPANFESLIDDPRVVERFAQDEYMPYWAEFWPAARVLAERVAAWPDAEAADSESPVLEVGCGLGLVGLVAAARGRRVVLSDYDADSLEFARTSAECNGLAVETRVVDWRRSYPDLMPRCILAAEVLYETRLLDPIAAFVRGHLAPGGAAIFCDANRRPADGFPQAAERAGLRVEGWQERIEPADGPPISARMFRVTLA